jgi:hypothetical protein
MEETKMTVERALRLIAGVFIVVSVALGYYVSPWWYLFTVFVGLNLFQSAFTNWCPMITILRRFGLRCTDPRTPREGDK